MNELYEAIEKKIKASGYPRTISGADVYDDIVFEYHITIQDENFNLGILTMKTPEGVYQADFDAE